MHKRRLIWIVFGMALLTGLLILASPVSAAPLDAPHEQGGTHTVNAGETLSGIAARYGVSASALASANGISNPNFVYAGQRLVIPGTYSGGATAAPGGYASGGSVHFVQAGETLSSIAARYGTTATALASANGISNPNHIYAGQRLTIVSGGGYNQIAYNPQPVYNTDYSGAARWAAAWPQRLRSAAAGAGSISISVRRC